MRYGLGILKDKEMNKDEIPLGYTYDVNGYELTYKESDN